MQISMLIGPVILPVLFWAGYHYHKDRHLPEPLGHLLLAFLLGAGCYWLGILMYAGLGLIGLRFDAFLLAETSHVSLLLYALLAIGPIEELAKLLPFLLIIWRFEKFNEPIDGIIYASFIALGFSAVENIHYLQYVSDIEALARGFAGPVVHIVFASIWGYYIGNAHLQRRHFATTVILSLTATAILHGLYDYLVIALPSFALPASAMLVVGIWSWRLYLIRGLNQAARKVAIDTRV
ncbi:MAG: PrsW family intramembrane metalloprotease [Proteobacteria bacterium]|nr:PrsW family intramembrane metalloprotease [Pseudomonadota bacterium]